MTRIQVEELELRHKKFKIKKLTKRLFFGFLISAFIGVLSIIYVSYTKKDKMLTFALEEKKQMMKRLELARIREENRELVQKKKTELLQANEKPPKQEKIIIQTQNINIKELKKDFYSKASFDKAILLSKIYFENKDYKKSIFWSLKANDIDRTREESWILFAKAKLALGEKIEAKKALRTLTNFYDYSNSEEIAFLLD